MVLVRIALQEVGSTQDRLQVRVTWLSWRCFACVIDEACNGLDDCIVERKHERSIRRHRLITPGVRRSRPSQANADSQKGGFSKGAIQRVAFRDAHTFARGDMLVQLDLRTRKL